jgi:serine/threonine protein kinase/Tfp pilus assembly protein PilF
MAPRLQTVEEIFHGALECAPDELSAFLEKQCGGHDVLRGKVEELLAAHRKAENFIEIPLASLPASIVENGQADSLIGQTIGHYKICKLIGDGGMGEVYLATDVRAGRKAVLKLLPTRFTGDPERLKRFQQEARTVAGLNHPNILTIYEIGADDSVEYIASELIEGETLRQRLSRGRIQLNDAVEIAIQVAGALAAAHSAGIVHRDVKPENIMLRPDGYVKVLDFGIAKLTEQEVPVTVPEEEALLLVETNLGSVLGTVQYMSPEQARGAPVDKRTDIWSLGVVLYEMTVGHAPFAGDTPREVMTQILVAEPPPPLTNYAARAPNALQHIVSKTLQKDPRQRYQNASEMLEDLKALRRKFELAAEIAKSAPKKSIAVLPFENLSQDKGNAYFADGIQEEILTRLSRIGDLKVISRTSTQRFRNTTESVHEIAKQLGVATILEGSVRKAGDKVRVHVQLIDTENDVHIWAERYDRQLVDIFAVESEIAAKIADSLQAKLTGAEQRAIASRPTQNSEAHELYLRGRFYWNRWLGPVRAVEPGGEEFDKSRQYYQQAIELDPNYALAYAGLADFYGFAFGFGLLPPEEKWAKAQEDNAKKALELDPTLGEAYNPLAADKLYYHRDWPGAERDFRRGLELSPNFAEMHAHYAFCLVVFGRNEEALVEMRRALDLDPLSPRFGFASARLFFFMRQYDAALDQCRKTLELDPSSAFAHEWLGDAYEKKQMQKEAMAEWSKALHLSGVDEDASLLERTYAKSGFDAAVHALAQKRLERFKEKAARGEYVPAVQYVTAYMRLGDKEQAFVWLAKAVEERNRLAFEIKVNPILDPLRDDPRFVDLMRRWHFCP